MNREEILAMNRKESEGKEDERELKIFADASKIGMAVGGILSVLIVLFSRIVDIPVLGFAAWAVYFAMFGSRRAYQYAKTKEPKRLAQAIIGIVAVSRNTISSIETGQFNPTAKLALVLCIALEVKFEDLFYFD